MRILIFGAGGFVGQYLLTLLAKEYKATVFATKHPCEQDPLPLAAAVYHLRLPDAKAVAEIIQNANPDVIYHLAAQSSVVDAWEKPYDTLAVNVQGTLDILEAMRQQHSKARLMLIGSAEEYGMPRSNLFAMAEDEPLRPVNLYGVTKLCAEQLAMAYHTTYGLDVVAIRAFSHIGAGQSPRFVLSDFCKQAAAIECGSQPPVLYTGNLHRRRDFTDVRDIVRAYVALAEKGKSGQSYNVGSGQAIALSTMVEILREECRVPFTVQTDMKRVRPVDMPFQCANIHYLTNETGWQPQIPLRDTIKEMLAIARTQMQTGGTRDAAGA